MFIAVLVGIFKLEELPQEYIPFVRYKSSLEDRDIDENEGVQA